MNIITVEDIRQAEDRAGVSRLSDAYMLDQDDRSDYLDFLIDSLDHHEVDTETYNPY